MFFAQTACPDGPSRRFRRAVPDLALARAASLPSGSTGWRATRPSICRGSSPLDSPVAMVRRRSLRRLATEWTILTAIATVIAAGCPLGATRAIGAFERAFSVSCVGPPRIHACQPGAVPVHPVHVERHARGSPTRDRPSFRSAVDRACRSLRPYARTATLALNDFTTQWIADVSRANRWHPVACGNPALLGLLITYQFRLAGAAPAAAAWRTRPMRTSLTP